MSNKKRNRQRQQEKQIVSTEPQTPETPETDLVAASPSSSSGDSGAESSSSANEGATGSDNVELTGVDGVASAAVAPEVQQKPLPVIPPAPTVERSLKASNIIKVVNEFSRTMGPNYPLQAHEQANAHRGLASAMRALLTLEYDEFVSVYKEILGIVKAGLGDAWLPTCRFKNLPLAAMSKGDFYFYQHFMHIVIATSDASSRQRAIRMENLKSLVKTIGDDLKSQKLLTFYADRQ